MDKSARVEAHKYTGMTRAELHSVAVERVEHYAQMQHRGEPFHHLLDAWQWVEQGLRIHANLERR